MQIISQNVSASLATASGGYSSRGRASALLSLLSHSPGLCVKVSLGEILKPKLLLMYWSSPCMAATVISV